MILQALTKRSEIKKATQKLFSHLRGISPEKYHIIYSSAGGSTPVDVFYSPEYDFWCGNSVEPDRYWNPFGLGRPRNGATITGRCQINYACENVNLRMAGLLAKDAEGRLYLLHSGKIGGGRKGVGKNAFLDFYTGERIMVTDGERQYEYLLIDRIDNERFFLNVRIFIESVYGFKGDQEFAGYKAGTSAASPLSGDEYDGVKTYDLPARSVTASNDHAIVTRELLKTLRSAGFNAGRDRFRDVYTVGLSGETDRVFEVKTGLSRQKLYTAVGQLMLHSLSGNTGKVFVTEELTDNGLANDLKKLGISMITFKWSKNGKNVTFTGIDQLLQ